MAIFSVEKSSRIDRLIAHLYANMPEIEADRAVLLTESYRDTENLPIIRRADFREAVLAAAEIAERGDTVLLSPACTSYDAFKNFEERGDVFVEIVRSLPELHN